jgi:hypothetical protein
MILEQLGDPGAEGQELMVLVGGADSYRPQA